VTTTPNRIYLARLAGASVFDSSGDQVGKVRDFVITPRTKFAAVVGVVVEVAPRRRIYVPMTRVTAFDPRSLVISGMVNLRRFERRPGEQLVMAEVLDTRVTVRASGERAVVEDVAMSQERTREWNITRVFVRKNAGGFGRRGATVTAEWNEVDGLVTATSDQGVESLLATALTMPAPDVANLIQGLPRKRQLDLVSGLAVEQLADVFEELPEELRVEIMSALGVERATDVLEEMDPGYAADLLSDLPPEQAEEYLEAMEPDDAEDLRRLLTYDDFSAGGMMTTEPIVLSADATVAEALARVRVPELSPAVASQVYVVRPPLETPTGRYLGVAHVQRLLREPPSQLVSAILDSSLAPIGPSAPLGQVARYFATYNLVALPVVDENDHLLGAVTIDDVIDHMLPGDWRERDEEA
jgi:CBS domain-containing protein